MAMVIPALEFQTSPEQRARWLPLAKSFKILCAYVQTELGHGSNVRGIETTATYDVATQEWDIHSPTLTSTKWWPGGLGKTATHAVRLAVQVEVAQSVRAAGAVACVVCAYAAQVVLLFVVLQSASATCTAFRLCRLPTVAGTQAPPSPA
jgi:alkylation response protein AidB-like acyl-CoA dehydrogenase